MNIFSVVLGKVCAMPLALSGFGPAALACLALFSSVASHAQPSFFEKPGFAKSTFEQASALTTDASTSAAQKTVVTTPRVRAELLAYAPDGVKPGRTLWLGLQLKHQPQWHTYWKNPGDSGMATKLEWSLPEGIKAGAIAWPVPKTIPVAHLANYGYEDTVLLVTPFRVSEAFQTPTNVSGLTVRLKANWLACKTECIPEEGTFEITLPMDRPTVGARAFFNEAQSHEPKLHAGTATFSPTAQSLKLLVLGLPDSWKGKQLEVFSEMPEMIETASKPEQSWAGDQWSASLKLSSYRTQTPSEINWVIKIAGTQPFNPSLRLMAKLDGAWQAAVLAMPNEGKKVVDASLEGQMQTGEAHQAHLSWQGWWSPVLWLAIGGALLGGLLLNFMPCVLPVLALKLLSFAPNQHLEGVLSVAKVRIETTGMARVESDRVLNLRSSSGLFALGMVSGFVLLGAALLGMRLAGHDLGWGFQLQSSYAVVVLTLLFLLIALNLWGVFEVRLFLPQRWVQAQSKHPGLEALASGFLAVLIATPCTAPFMGASLGVAIALPAMQALLVFVALGLGMALPFLLVALHPPVGYQLLKILPKPGPWMVVIRQFLAWPIVASCLWLLWIYAQQTSVNSAFVLAWILLVLSGLIWAFNVPKGALRTSLTLIFGVLFLASGILWQNTWRDSVAQVDVPQLTVSASAAQTQTWGDWSVAAQQAARAQGRTVFVDFTAAWCLTCQINKATTLEKSEVLAAFKAKNVVLLRADWTRPNTEIANALTQLGRSGLPVYALYAPAQQQPQLLPEVLTPATVLAALSK